MDAESNKTLMKLGSPPKQASTKTNMTDAEGNKTQLGTKKKYFALMDWSNVGNFSLLKSAAYAYMERDRNQEMLLRNATVPQHIVRRAVTRTKNI